MVLSWMLTLKDKSRVQSHIETVCCTVCTAFLCRWQLILHLTLDLITLVNFAQNKLVFNFFPFEWQLNLNSSFCLNSTNPVWFLPASIKIVSHHIWSRSVTRDKSVVSQWSAGIRQVSPAEPGYNCPEAKMRTNSASFRHVVTFSHSTLNIVPTVHTAVYESNIRSGSSEYHNGSVML